MTRTLTSDEILEMPVCERLNLIATLWDSIDSDKLPIPASHQRALDASIADYARNPEQGQSWDEVRDELFLRR